MAGLKFADTAHLAHAYIVSAGDLAEGEAAARDIAAAAVCSGGGKRPCGVCRDCRKAMAGTHPDIITVRRLCDDKGKEKQFISVDQVREMAADAYVLPNEAQGKAYIVLTADTMNANAQNAALKLLEEPPRGVMLILCTGNPQQLLPTVRSRCVEISVNGGGSESGEPERLAREFLSAVAGGRVRLFTWCAANEGMDGRAAASFIAAASALTADALCGRERIPGLERKDAARLDALLRRCAAYLKVHTGVKHIFGLLAVRAAEERI